MIPAGHSASRTSTHSHTAEGRFAWVLVTAVILAYLVLRLLLIPERADLSYAFTHDSGYLARVAENLANGDGLVIDALWLVFLMPPAVPMPYHNANPLFPILTAAVSQLTGTDVLRTGFFVSTLSAGILIFAIVALVQPVVRHRGWALAIAAAVSLFPPLLIDSLVYLTDGLCTALCFAVLALLVREPSSSRFGMAAGAFLGLAWLTRAATILVIPAIVVYLVLKHRSWLALRRLAEIAIAAVIVASPWLIHTKIQWGSYLRSDSEYAVVQNLAADKFHGSSLFRFWHSPEPPPRLTAFIRESPAAFARHVATGAVKVARRTLSWWSLGSIPVAAFMAACIAVWGLGRGRFLTPEAAGVAVFAAASFGLLAIRADSFEERYIAPVTVFYALFSALGAWRLWQLAGTPERRAVAAAAIGIVWGLLIPSRAWQTYVHTYRSSPSLVAYRSAASEVDRRFARGTPVVVGNEPYFYTVETKRVALSIPDGPDDVLLRYMDKYGSRFVFLTGQELDFWRPAWRSPWQLPGRVRLAGTLDDGYVFEALPPAEEP